MNTFAAIDFETADYWRDSACSVGVVLVENGRMTERLHQLIRPPRKEFVFTGIHGLTWNDVCDSPTFRQLWPQLQKFIDKAEFLVAHNASFDKSVLYACCAAERITPPTHQFQCTMRMARSKWNLQSVKLPSVCRHLGIQLNHHNALSDAEACAQIAVQILR